MLISLPSRNLYCDIVGPGAGVVVGLAHSLSADSTMWAEQVPALLASGFTVLRVDMRGHGGSGIAAEPCTMSDLADDFLHVMNVLDVGTLHFIGLSIGGMIGIDLLTRHSNRILSAMLCDTAASAVPGGISMWRDRFDRIAEVGSCEAIADETMDRWFGESLERSNRWMEIRGTIAATSRTGYTACAEAIMGFDARPQLDAIRTPTLIVCGAQDIGTPAEGNRAIAEAIPGARYEEIANARHMPNIQFPEKFNSIMIGWLRDQERPS